MDFMIDENLLEVFSNLDALSLINASLVCQRWSDLISTSPLLMKQFELMIFIQSRVKKQNVFPNGKYRNLTLECTGNLNKIDKKIANIIGYENECLRNVTLKNFDGLRTVEAISVLPNITKLTILNFRHEDLSVGVIDLPNLRHLELMNSIPFAEVIGHHSINILKIFGAPATAQKSSNDLETLLDNFLKKCLNLKDLTLTNVQIENFVLKSDTFGFNLEALTIENFNFDEENLIEFLVKQKNSLKKLTILHTEPKIIIPLIIFSQLSLDELEIDVGLIASSFRTGAINSSIKKLIIKSTWMPHRRATFGRRVLPDVPQVRELMPQNQQGNMRVPINDQIQRLDRVDPAEKASAAEQIILACRSVENFMILELTFDSLLQQLNWTHANLKILKLQTIPKFISPVVQFDKLEVLEVDKIESGQDIEDCTFLVIYCPNLMTLKINFVPTKHFNSKFFVTIVNKVKSLREIHIGTKCRFSLDMINAVKIIKNLRRPLKVISFDFCSIDDDDKKEFNDIFMDDLKLNFHLNSTKFFSRMINETRLGRMQRKIDEKNENLEQQKRWSIYREQAIERYKHFNSE